MFDYVGDDCKEVMNVSLASVDQLFSHLKGEECHEYVLHVPQLADVYWCINILNMD